MTEQSTDSANGNADLQIPSEFDMLKQRAKLMGITHSPNIGLETLRAKVLAAQEGKRDDTEASMVAQETNPLDIDGIGAAAHLDRPETAQELRERLLREQMKLVRLRITNMDPKKAQLPGEIFTVGNEFIGTIRKFVPYGEATDNGYHVPYIIYKELESRKFLNIRVTKKNGRDHVEQNWAKEFALEVLEPLTQEELNRLAAAQAAGHNMD